MEKNRLVSRENTLMIETLTPDFGNNMRDQGIYPRKLKQEGGSKKKKKKYIQVLPLIK